MSDSEEIEADLELSVRNAMRSAGVVTEFADAALRDVDAATLLAVLTLMSSTSGYEVIGHADRKLVGLGVSDIDRRSIITYALLAYWQGTEQPPTPDEIAWFAVQALIRELRRQRAERA